MGFAPDNLFYACATLEQFQEEVEKESKIKDILQV